MSCVSCVAGQRSHSLAADHATLATCGVTFSGGSVIRCALVCIVCSRFRCIDVACSRLYCTYYPVGVLTPIVRFTYCEPGGV